MLAEINSSILWGKGELNTQEIPNIIWIYWDPLVNSPLVEICINQIKKLHTDFEVNVLNKYNLNEFLPEITPLRKDLPFANYADIIRLALLKKYGGIWIDSSVLITEKIDWIFNFKEKADLIGFYSDYFTENYEFPILENWFLATSPNSIFITDWHEEYMKCYTSENPKKYYGNLQKKWLQKIDENLSEYLLPYLSAIKIMRTNDNYRLLMHPANASAHYYNFGLKLKPHQLCEVFLFNKSSQTYPKMIKFERRGREAIDQAINRGQYTRKSLIFKIAPDPRYFKNKIPRFFRYLKFIFINYLSKIQKHK